jgi:hypothetical protein
MKKSSLFYICIASCFFFQILPLLVVLVSPRLQAILPFKGNLLNYFFLTLFGLGLTTLAYFIFQTKRNVGDDIFSTINANKQTLFWQIGELFTYGLFIPALVVALSVYVRVMGSHGYGQVETTGLVENRVLYTHLMAISFLFAGYTSNISKIKLLKLLALVIIPRFIISSSGPRFILFQALLPSFIFVYPLVKDIIRKNILLIAISAVLLFLLPFLVGNRNTEITFLKVYIYGSPIIFLLYYKWDFFANMHFVTAGLLYSLFSMDIFNYKKYFDLGTYKVRFDWIYTRLTIGPAPDYHLGSGGNPIYEGMSEGLIGFIILFLILGYICARFDFRNKSMFNRFLFPHIIAKVFFIWRGTFVELFDRAFYYAIIFSFVYYGITFWQRRKAFAG